MPKLLAFFVISALAFGLLAPMTSAASKSLDTSTGTSGPYCGSPTTVRLLTDRNVNAGIVKVANNQTTLFVTYTTYAKYKLTYAQLAVANLLANIPVTSKGNPVPGQFPYQKKLSKVSSYTFQIPLNSFGSMVYVAAHADILRSGERHTEGAWGEGTPFVPNRRSWGMYFTYNVQPCNQPPVAGNDAFSTNEDTALNVAAPGVLGNDSDSDNDPITAQLVTSTTHGALSLNADGSFTYTPNANYNGPDSFTYKAKDSLGNLSNPATVSLIIAAVNDLPVAVNDTKSVLESSVPTVVDVLANDSDAEGDPFTISSATAPAHGTVVIAGDGLSLTYQPDSGYCNAGSPTDDFTYTLAPGGATATVAVTVTCVDDQPTAVNDSATVTEDSSATAINVLANDTDPDGGPKAIASVTQPANGLVVITGGGTGLTYKPNANYCNGGSPTDNFTYTLTPGGTTATVAVTVTCVDDAPAAVNDAATLSEDASATAIDVLVNDTDVDGGPKSIASVTQPVNGTVVITGGGTGLTYQPDANACNNGSPTDNFTYTLTPGGSTATVAVTVTCINDAPGFNLPASPNQSVAKDAGAQTVAGFATNISAGPANESGQTVTFHVSNNNTALFASQPDISEATGNLTYTPANGATGSATVSVYLNDNGGTSNGGVDTSATQTFTITVILPNATPVANNDGPYTTDEDTSLNPLTPVLNNDTDADSDPLTAILVSGPAHSSLFTLYPNGTFAYTPTANYNGSDSFTYKANDGQSDSNVATVSLTVTPVNDPPSFTPGGNVTVAEDSGGYSAAWATSLSAGPVDEGGQNLDFIIQSNSNAALFSVAPAIAANGALSFTPAANANGIATLNLVLHDDGGGADTSAASIFTITVTAVNDPPANSVPAAQTVNEDTDLVFSSGNSNALSVADVDAGAGNVQVTVSALNGMLTPVASGAAISGSGTASTTITGTLAQVNSALNGLKYKGNANWNSTRGSETLTIVTDDQGNTGSGGALSDTDTVNITVSAVNDEPTALAKNFNAQANMKITGLTGLLTGATDPDTGDGSYTATFTVGTVSATTPSGGTISNLNSAAGTFDFDPPAGATGNVTFTYTVCDSGNPGPSACSAPATVTVNVSGPVIWFVNPAVSNGDGRLSNPFNNLASADAVDASGQRIFVYSGTTPTASIILNANEWLIGQGVTGTTFDTLFGLTPPAGTIARPALAGARPVVQGNVTLANNAVVRGLNIQPASGTQGLTANGVTGLTVSEVSITTTNAIAVNLTGGANGAFSFTAISANGGTSGIVLTNANTSGGSFTVTGTGSAGSGGTIQNMTDSGILGTTTANVSLSYMNILNNGNAVSEGGVRMTGLTGTNFLTSSTVSGSYEDNVFVQNTSGTLTGLTIQGPNCAITNNNTSFGNTGITVLSAGTANMTVTVNNCQFSGNRTDTIHVDAGDSASLNTVISNNTITAGTSGNNQGNLGIDVTSAGTSTVTYAVTNNKVGTNGVTSAPLLNTGINVFAGGSTTTMSGFVTGNTVFNAGAGASGYGIRVFSNGSAAPGSTTVVADVSNNVVSNVGFDYGILVEASGTSFASALRLKLTNNNVSVLSTALDAIRVQARNTSNVCARVSGNTTNTGGTGFFGLYLRQANTATFNLEGGTASLAGNNPGAATTGFTGTLTNVAANFCGSIP